MILYQVHTPYDRLMAHYLCEVGCEMGSDATAEEISFHARIRFHEFLGQSPSSDIDAFYAAASLPAVTRH